jgi:hypothetical protein
MAFVHMFVTIVITTRSLPYVGHEPDSALTAPILEIIIKRMTLSLHVIGHQIAHFSTMAVGTQVTFMAAKVLAHTLAANIGHILAKFMASAAFKKVLYALIHK